MPLVDPGGRAIDYLRLSITDDCNLRCLYCRPNGAAPERDAGGILGFDEALRICAVLCGLGIRAIRITGGEPLLRKGVAGFVRRLKALPGIARLSVTTNGALLGASLRALADAGLDSLNVSLDTLDEEKFARLTGGRPGTVAEVLRALDEALALGLSVKINCVPLRGFNEEELADIALLARDRKIAARFIELMPLGAASAMLPVPTDETMAIIEAAFGRLQPTSERPGLGPAEYRALPGFVGLVGFIGAISRGFCEGCNRLRLTSRGILRACLSSEVSADLGALSRAGADDGEIAGAALDLVARKPAGHSMGGAGAKLEKANHDGTRMFSIGG